MSPNTVNPVLDLVLNLPGGPLMVVAWAILAVEGSLWACGRWVSRQQARRAR